MRVIALTGGIATGKSTVARLLADRGATVVDADDIARYVVEPGTDALAEIVSAFGESVLREDGSLDRAALGGVVFGDAERRRVLESILHPRVRAELARRIADADARGDRLVVVDIPLLYETERESEFDGVLLVYAHPEHQRQRLHARDNLDGDQVDQRLAAQLPIEDKRRRATWVVENDGDLAETKAQIDQWWNRIIG